MRFLIADPLAPRSLRYALDEISRTLATLAAAASHQRTVEVTPRLMSDVDAVRSGGSDPMDAVSAVETACDRLHSTIYDTTGMASTGATWFPPPRPVPAPRAAVGEWDQ